MTIILPFILSMFLFYMRQPGEPLAPLYRRITDFHERHYNSSVVSFLHKFLTCPACHSFWISVYMVGWLLFDPIIIPLNYVITKLTIDKLYD